MMDKPDMSHMTTDELAVLMMACSLSHEPSDKEFAKFCREEIKRRKSTANSEQRSPASDGPEPSPKR